MNLIRFVQGNAQPEVDLSKTYDAIVVGSGAAGGMAAHVLTSQGMKVLMLEAGKKLDINKELKSMEWPYEHPRRGEMPPGPSRAVAQRVHDPPAAVRARTRHTPKVYSYVQGWGGTDYSKNIVVDEKDHPYTGHELRLGPRAAARRQDEHLGPPGAAPLRLRLQGEEPRRLRRGLADLLHGHRAVLRPRRSVSRDLRASRRTSRTCPTASSSGPHACAAAEVTLRNSLEEDGPRADAVSRGRHDRRAEAQQVSQPLLRPRRVQPARRAAATSTRRSTRRPA